MQELEADEYFQTIEPGGEIRMAIAINEAQMCRQLLMAIGISTLFRGGLVHIEGWLPGLTLKVQALNSLEPGDQITVKHIWPGMYARLASWIDAPSDADALDLSFDGAYCVLIPDVFTWHVLPVAFTLKCVPTVPGFV